MKRILIAVSIFIILLSGCVRADKDYSGNLSHRGVWLSFYEIGDIMKSSRGLKTELEDVIENCKELNIDNVYIHVRSHCDSVFSSKYFPLNESAKIYDYDVFEYMISEFHKNGIKVHAWINPYRVSTSTSDINEIASESPAYKWLKDENADNDRNVCFYNGIYLNPAESEVQSLIINGVKEIVENYNVDGIAFDDYFYPTANEEFDKISYDEYKANSEKPLALDDWRRTNVNTLISAVYNAIKSEKENAVFTVSPSHSIDRNRDEFYADTEFWIENGIIDVIMPQIYFGFEYPDSKYRFESLLEAWKELVKPHKDIELIISLPAYKIGTDSERDNEEWSDKTDIISRQAQICYTDEKVEGFAIFSYSSLFSEDELNTKQRNNLKEVINSFKLSENGDG